MSSPGAITISSTMSSPPAQPTPPSYGTSVQTTPNFGLHGRDGSPPWSPTITSGQQLIDRRNGIFKEEWMYGPDGERLWGDEWYKAGVPQPDPFGKEAFPDYD